MVPKSQVQNVLGYPRTSWNVPDMEAVLGPRVPGPICAGISQDILDIPAVWFQVQYVLGYPRTYQDVPAVYIDSLRSQGPRSKMS